MVGLYNLRKVNRKSCYNCRFPKDGFCSIVELSIWSRYNLTGTSMVFEIVCDEWKPQKKNKKEIK